MLRVYLDWNIYSYLKQKKNNDEVYKTLFTLIKNCKNDILFPYSLAHLTDLKRSFYKSEEAKRLTYEDIEFLTEISKSHCLYEDYKDKSVSPLIIDPKECFDEMLEKKSFENFDFDTIFGENDDVTVKALWDTYMNLLKEIPSGVNIDEIDKLPKKYQKLKDLFQYSRKDNSFWGLLKDMTNLLGLIEKNTDTYKSIRNVLIEDMKIDTDPKNWGNPFVYLNKFMKKSKINKSFEEITTEHLNNTDKPKSRFEYFSQYYISLDMFGFHRDSKLSNLVDDATHAYCGAYCDFFVTEDDNTYHKAKAIYEKFGIETIVCKASEFPNELEKQFIMEQNNRNSFILRLEDVIQSSLLIDSGVDDENNSAYVFKIEKHLVSYFNRMQVTTEEDINTQIFYKRRKNYSKFMFWTELQMITNKLVSELGIDENQRLEFCDEEKKEILEDKWLGRVWVKGKSLLTLYYQAEPFGLTFQIMTLKENNLQSI